MAEIISNSSAKRQPGVRKNKKLSTRVDLTPMVDLGFLLITFFVFTTSISEPAALKLAFPKDTEPTPIKASNALTILLSENNSVFYYEGQLKDDGTNMLETGYPGLRTLMIRKKKEAPLDKLMVIIKPLKNSVYRNTVDALDEMLINDVKSYAILDVTETEDRLIRLSSRHN